MPTPVINRTTETMTRYELLSETRAQLLNELDQRKRTIAKLKEKKEVLQAELKRKVSALYAVDDIKCDDPADNLRKVFKGQLIV